MNKHISIICILLLVFLFQAASCKKTYPDDIPEWLRTDIKSRIEAKDCNNGDLSVREYKVISTGALVYCYDFSDNTLRFYSYDGIQLCKQISTGSQCEFYINNKNTTYTRTIWDPTEKCK
jgi:hypothetical protein